MAITVVQPKHWADATGELERRARRIIREEFPVLTYLRILYAWREPPNFKERRPESADVKRLTARDRDLFGFDIVVTVAAPIWKELGPRAKKRLLWHQLFAVDVEVDEASRPMKDDHGRVRVHLRKPDLAIGSFEEEIERWGPSAQERVVLKTFVRLYKRVKEKEGEKGDHRATRR